jgi:hypothetical protein
MMICSIAAFYNCLEAILNFIFHLILMLSLLMEREVNCQSTSNHAATPPPSIGEGVRENRQIFSSSSSTSGDVPPR